MEKSQESQESQAFNRMLDHVLETLECGERHDGPGFSIELDQSVRDGSFYAEVLIHGDGELEFSAQHDKCPKTALRMVVEELRRNAERYGLV
jgi:hypothetical protein